ncbi:MAG: Tex-like N-terminal domain-containing protein [Spirochaetales bacterium]|nr:Tex-like N-terminal domain-containing protein [Spirochaetales bacterium]
MSQLPDIEELKIDEIAILARIAEELGVKAAQVSAVISLSAEGCTVPFISRYRKERTGSLDEVQVRDSVHKFESYKNLEERRIEITKGIAALGKLDETLYDNILKASALSELEDLWAPYKKKKKTSGMIAQERGLGPLAEIMLSKDKAGVDAAAPEFLRQDEETPELSVASAEEAIAGAKDIIAERLSQDIEMRAALKDWYRKTGTLVTKGIGDDAAKEKSTYQMYWDYSEPLATLKSHRVLAVNRAEREGALDLTIAVDLEGAAALLKSKAFIHNEYHEQAIEDGLQRLLSPAVVREIRSDATEYAESHAIDVFSENLKNLLMQPPLKGSRVLGIDPGIRTGSKCAALDETGKFLDYFVINQETKLEEAKKAIAASVKKHKIEIIAVGNGTASHEVQAAVAASIEENGLGCSFTAVDEDGASVYSASDMAREEFPDLDLTIRGAISIGRRLQDPLAELVKIDPKSIGVGLYQHDVNQKKLTERLDEVVGSVVNQVGVNLNTASHALLKYVSGINFGLARKIVKFREEKGAISSRAMLTQIPGLGEKTFEQCAGFLKIPGSDNELDNSWVHPENYALAAELLSIIKAGADPSHEQRAALKEKYSVGDTTLDDIIAELKKPNRDPRENLPPPILQKGVLSFDDLKEGMKVTGKVKNVVDFGAFVDIGIKESALIHVSELSDRFVRDPMEVLKVGDVKEFTIISLDGARKRIGLSLKQGSSGHRQEGRHQGDHRREARPIGLREDDARVRAGQTGKPLDGRQDSRQSSSGERPQAKIRLRPKESSTPEREPRGLRDPERRGRDGRDFERKNREPYARPRQSREDDGMTYNPFADFFKKS